MKLLHVWSITWVFKNYTFFIIKKMFLSINKIIIQQPIFTVYNKAHKLGTSCGCKGLDYHIHQFLNGI